MSTTLDRSKTPAPAAVKPFRFPEVESAKLGNGLTVLAARHGDLPLVTVELVLDAGAAADPAHRAGVAHLTANLLETGTERYSADRVAWALESLGVTFEADVTWDATLLRIVTPRHNLEGAMSIFAEIVRRPSFPGTEFERVRSQQIAELMQRRKEPRALGNDMAARFIFRGDVPYARPLPGTIESVTAIARQEILAFYASSYRPDCASLLFVGDIDLADAQRLAQESFDSWTAGRAHRTRFHVTRASDVSAIYVVDRPDAVQSEIRIGDVGVPRDHGDYFPLIVMNSILGGAFTSRLNMNLREKNGFTYGVRSSFAFRREPGPFVIGTAVATDVTARAVEEALREVTQLRETGATEAEVKANKDYLAGVLPLELQTTEQLASRLADLIVYDLPLDYFESYPQRILAVTPEDVQRVAREHLRPDRFAIVVVGPADRISDPLRELGIGRVEVHSVDE